MRKKSHVSLAMYLADQMEEDELTDHHLSFYIGSVLPDCKPSFISTRHEYSGTFEMVSDMIRDLTENVEYYGTHKRTFMRRLGEVTHYLADYFTFPHNTIYPGSIADHCVYEGELKFALREYLRDGQAFSEKIPAKRFRSCEDLLDYISRYHEIYLNHPHNIENDCWFIMNLNYTVTVNVVEMYCRNLGYSAHEYVEAYPVVAVVA